MSLGLTSATFWAMTPRMYFAFRKHCHQRERRENMRWANMYALFVNAHKGKDSPTVTAEDFMKPAHSVSASSLEYNVEQQIALARMYTTQVRASQGMPLT